MIWLLYLVLTLLFMLLIGNAMTYWLQYPILFRPKVLPLNHRFDFEDPFEEITIPSVRNGMLHGLWFHQPGQTSSKGLVLYFHGNVGNMKRWAKLYERQFKRHDVDVFFLDYRRYGKSRGRIGERTFFTDAEVVFDFFAEQYASDQITIYGRSIGSGMASYLASVRPARQVLLETPFSSIPALFFAYYPFFPKLFLFRFRFRNAHHLKGANMPIHIVVSSKDRVVPPVSSERLKYVLKEGDTYTVVEGARHNDLLQFDAFKKWMEAHFG